MLPQPENVGGRVQPSKIDEFGNRLFAQAFNVERAARHEMAQSLKSLRRADQAAGAAHVNLPFLADRFAMAFGAMAREHKRRARFIAGEILDDLRNDVTSALDANAIANAEPQPLDLVTIMESDVGDDHAPNA